MNRIGLLTERSLLLIILLAGCWDGDELVGACPAVGKISVIAEVVDSDGRPAAVGATVTISKRGLTASEEGFSHPLLVHVWAQNAGGIFDIRVTKPWHEEARISEVYVPVGPCGVLEPTTARVTLSELPDAPPVRQVVLPPYDYLFGIAACGSPNEVAGYALTDGDASGEIVWESRDVEVVTVEAKETGPGGYNAAQVTVPCDARLPSSTWVIGMAKADPSVRDSFEVVLHL